MAWIYDMGQRLRVVKPGASLHGMVPIDRNAWSGWSRKLEVGEVIVSNGSRRGWGSDPIDEVMFADEKAKQAGANYVTFSPQDFGTPKPGYLEPVGEEN